MEKLTATLKSIRPETADVKIFTLDVQGQGFHYLPGQWLDLFVEINGKEEVGGYSLTSAPQEVNQSLELAVKSSSHHPVTRYLHETAQVGDTVKISQGQGNCVFTPDLGHKIVLIAGGIGITPLMSILRTIRDQHPDTQLALLYSAHSPEAFAYAEEIRQAAEAHEHILAAFTCTDLEADLPDWIHFQERIDTFFLKTMNLPPDAHYFICGPSPMLREVEESLLSIAVPAAQIHYEKW